MDFVFLADGPVLGILLDFYASLNEVFPCFGFSLFKILDIIGVEDDLSG